MGDLFSVQEESSHQKALKNPLPVSLTGHRIQLSHRTESKALDSTDERTGLKYHMAFLYEYTCIAQCWRTHFGKGKDEGCKCVGSWGKTQASEHSNGLPGNPHLPAVREHTEEGPDQARENPRVSSDCCSFLFLRGKTEQCQDQGISFIDVVYTILKSIVFQILLTVILSKSGIFMGSLEEQLSYHFQHRNN